MATSVLGHHELRGVEAGGDSCLGKRIAIVEPGEVPDAAVASIGGMGSPAVGLERLRREDRRRSSTTMSNIARCRAATRTGTEWLSKPVWSVDLVSAGR